MHMDTRLSHAVICWERTCRLDGSTDQSDCDNWQFVDYCWSITREDGNLKIPVSATAGLMGPAPSTPSSRPESKGVLNRFSPRQPPVRVLPARACQSRPRSSVDLDIQPASQNRQSSPLCNRHHSPSSHVDSCLGGFQTVRRGDSVAGLLVCPPALEGRHRRRAISADARMVSAMVSPGCRSAREAIFRNSSSTDTHSPHITDNSLVLVPILGRCQVNSCASLMPMRDMHPLAAPHPRTGGA
jgi:hypothetical protein